MPDSALDFLHAFRSSCHKIKIFSDIGNSKRELRIAIVTSIRPSSAGIDPPPQSYLWSYTDFRTQNQSDNENFKQRLFINGTIWSYSDEETTNTTKFLQGKQKRRCEEMNSKARYVHFTGFTIMNGSKVIFLRRRRVSYQIVFSQHSSWKIGNEMTSDNLLRRNV